MEDPSTVIVIDNGSDTTRGGFANKNTPEVVFPAVVSRRRDTSAFIAQGQIDWYMGEEACNSRIGFRPPRRPVENGIVTNADDLELLWMHLFRAKLEYDPEGRSILLSEPALNSKGSREKAMQSLFEYLEIGALNFSTQEALALYASGRTTGLVIDSGRDSSRVVPVYEGFALRHGIRRLNIGGQQLTDYLTQALRQDDNNLGTFWERNLGGKVKEKCCYVAQDFEGEIKAAWDPFDSPTGTTYTLADGKNITVSKEGQLAPEALFRPPIMGLEAETGLHYLAVDSIAKSDASIKDTLYGNIVLAGGSSMFPGIESRMQSEITRLGSSSGATVRVHAPADRKHSAWVGGAMLSSLSTFQGMCVHAAEYDEVGPCIVHRRFL